MSMTSTDESRRLARLTSLQALQKAEPIDFSDIVSLGKKVFAAPIVFVSLIDGDYQHFLAQEGLSTDRLPRDQIFCNYTIQSDEVTVVPDTRLDARFASNPYVTGKPHIRFYAGAPLIYEPGIRLGTVCIVDAKPRPAEQGKLLILEHLAHLAVGRFRNAAETPVRRSRIDGPEAGPDRADSLSRPRVERW